MGIISYLEQRLIPFHYYLLVICSLAYMFGGMNVMIIGTVLASIGKEWALTEIEKGFLVSVGYAGMFFGASSSGFIADRIGRKRTLILMIILSSIFTALNSTAKDMTMMMILRFIAGIGLGGLLPLPAVYVSEYTPAKYRGRFVGIVETFWVYGALLSLLAGYIIIPLYGWRNTFLMALTPLLLIPGLLILPESIRYLESKGLSEEAIKILREKGLISKEQKIEVASSMKLERRTLKDITLLFSKAYINRTIVLWTLWAVLVYTYHGIFVFLPNIYVTTFGFGEIRSLQWALIVTLAQVPGYYSAALLLDRAGRKPIIAVYLFIAGISCPLMATAVDASQVLFWSSLIAFFNLGAWSGLYTYTPELYPTEIRGFGTGVAASIGRLAGIIAPIITTYLMTIAGYQLIWAFTVFSIAHIAAAIITVALGIETKSKTLEELASTKA